MKNRQLIRHSALFIVAFAAFGLSLISMINLANFQISNAFSAAWMLVQLVITFAGLLTLPVFMVSLFLRIISLATQPVMKRKKTVSDTIAS